MMTLIGKTQAQIDNENNRALLRSEMEELEAYLLSTDWYVARLADAGKEIPEEVKDKRRSAREKISEFRIIMSGKYKAQEAGGNNGFQ